MQYFYNERPIKINGDDMEQAKNFPEIKDFTIRIMDSDYSGMQLLYYSEDKGILASFPWLSDVDVTLKTMNMMLIFLGSKERPYKQTSGNNNLMIYAEDEYVYVLQGENSLDAGFETYFRVKYDTYIREWETLLTYFKSRTFNREEAFEFFGAENVY